MATKFFPLNLSSFKKVSSDKHTTTLRHDDGHEVKITHSALSPKLRGHLADMEMHAEAKSKPTNTRFKSVEHEVNAATQYADGGGVQKVDWSSVAKEGQTIPDPKMNAAMDSADAESRAKKMEQTQPQTLAEGGPVGPNNPKLAESKKVPPTTPIDNNVMYQKDNEIARLRRELAQQVAAKRPKNYSEGGNVDPEYDPYRDDGDNPDLKPQPTPTPERRYADGTPDQPIIAEPVTDEQVAQGDVSVPPSSAPQIPQDLQQKRNLYNQEVAVSTGKGRMVPPGAAFGPSGEEPDKFDALAWDRAEASFKGQQEQKVTDQADAAKNIASENAARQRAGLSPLAPTQQTQGQASTPVSSTTPQPAAPQGQPSAQSQDPFGTQLTADVFQKGLGEAKAGIAGEARALGQQGQAEAQALQQSVDKQQAAQQSYQDHFDALDQERQSFQQDLMNQHIDPQHYLNSMGTAGRVQTAVGLILGGMGGGMTHQENPALKFLNAQIDRDIGAQMAEMGKKENLLSANMKQFGNLRDATEMTRIMQNDIVSMQLKQAAAKAMDPLAKARAIQAAGKLDMDTAQMQGSMAMRKTLLGSVNAGSVDPAKIVNLLIPEGQRAEANKELTSAQNMVAGRDNVLSAYDKLTKINTVGNRIMSPIQSKRQIEGILGPIVAQLSKETAGRFTEQDAGMLYGLFPRPGNSDETNRINRARAVQLISEKMHFPILQTYGISPANWGRYGSTGQSRITESAPVLKK